jgi:hypothetical protein
MGGRRLSKNSLEITSPFGLFLEYNFKHSNSLWSSLWPIFVFSAWRKFLLNIRRG